jgi:hypothetical protein
MTRLAQLAQSLGLPKPLPLPPVLYTGPAVPTEWDAKWQSYTNLTRAQISAFQAMPQDLLFYAQHKTWRAAEPLSHAKRSADLAAAQIEFADAQSAAQAKLATVVAGINAKTVTERAHVDAAFSPKA